MWIQQAGSGRCGHLQVRRTERLAADSLPHLDFVCRVSDASEWQVMDVWWMLLLQAANCTGKGAIAANKAFLQANQAHAMPTSLLDRALTAHDLTLKACDPHCGSVYTQMTAHVEA